MPQATMPRETDQSTDDGDQGTVLAPGGLGYDLEAYMDVVIGRHCPRAIDADVMREAIGGELCNQHSEIQRAFYRQCAQLVLRCVPRADRIQQVSDVVNMV